MWQWNDGTMELYHYGVKGMKWGVRKACLMSKNGRISKLKSNAHSQFNDQRSTAKKDHTVMDAYKAERKRQRKYLATKRAVQVGRSIANQYLQSRNATLDGKPLRVNSTAMAVVNSILDYKYMKDTFK